MKKTQKKRTKTSARRLDAKKTRYMWTEIDMELQAGIAQLAAAHGLTFAHTVNFVLSWAVNASTITPDMDAVWEHFFKTFPPPTPPPLPGDEWKREMDDD